MIKKKMIKLKKIIPIIVILIIAIVMVSGCIIDNATSDSSKNQITSNTSIQENGQYDQKADVAAYIEKYNKLPSNYITKSEARSLGWHGGYLEPYAPGKSIGGDVFTNRERVVPQGKSYIECDIDTNGSKTRGAKRIIYSNDGDIYYTSDHYKTFTKLN